MVLDFVRDQRQLNDEEIVNLTYRIRDGDLSMVLRVYEQELKVIILRRFITNLFKSDINIFT
jgi:hypothetical protein